MIALTLCLAPAVMIVASLFEHRLGPAAAGLVAAAPATVIVGIIAVSSAHGVHAGTEFAASSAEHVSAQVIYALVLSFSVRRSGVISALFLGVVVYVGGAVALGAVPSWVAIGLGLLALLGGRRLLGERAQNGGERDATRASAAVLALRAGIALVAVAAILAACRLSGPALAGTIGAFRPSPPAWPSWSTPHEVCRA